MTIKSQAQKMSAAFRVEENHEGREIYKIDHGSPFFALVRDLHGSGQLPNDWVFETAARIADYLIDTYDGEVSEYPEDWAQAAGDALADWETYHLWEWLGGRFHLVDEFMEETDLAFGRDAHFGSLFDLLRAAQAQEIERMTYQILEFLADMDDEEE